MMRMEEPLDKESVWHIWSKKKRKILFSGSDGAYFFFIFIDFLLWHLILRLFLLILQVEEILKLLRPEFSE